MSIPPIRPAPDGTNPPVQNFSRSPLVQAARATMGSTTQKDANPSSQHSLNIVQSATPPPTPPTTAMIPPDIKPSLTIKAPSSREVIDLTTPSPGSHSPQRAASPSQLEKVDDVTTENEKESEERQGEQDDSAAARTEIAEQAIVPANTESQVDKATEEETEEGEIQKLLDQPDPSPQKRQPDSLPPGQSNQTLSSTEESMDINSDSNLVEDPQVTVTTSTDTSSSIPSSSIEKQQSSALGSATTTPIPDTTASVPDSAATGVDSLSTAQSSNTVVPDPIPSTSKSTSTIPDSAENSSNSTTPIPTPHQSVIFPLRTENSAPQMTSTPVPIATSSASPSQMSFSPGTTLLDGWKRIKAFGTSGSTAPSGEASEQDGSPSAPLVGSLSTAVPSSRVIARQLSTSPEPEEPAPAAALPSIEQPRVATTVQAPVENVASEDPLLTDILNDQALSRDLIPPLRALWSILNAHERAHVGQDRRSINILLVKHFASVLTTMGQAMLDSTRTGSETFVAGRRLSTDEARNEYENFARWSSANISEIWHTTGLPIARSLFTRHSNSLAPKAMTSPATASTHSILQGLTLPSSSTPVPKPTLGTFPAQPHQPSPVAAPGPSGESARPIPPQSAASVGFSAHASHTNVLQRAADLSRHQTSVIQSRRGGSLSGSLPGIQSATALPTQHPAAALPRPKSQPSILSRQNHHTQPLSHSHSAAPHLVQGPQQPFGENPGHTIPHGSVHQSHAQAGPSRSQASMPYKQPHPSTHATPVSAASESSQAPQHQEQPSGSSRHPEARPLPQMPLVPPQSQITIAMDTSRPRTLIFAQPSGPLHDATTNWYASQSHIAQLMQQVWDTVLVSQQQYSAEASARVSELENALAQSQQDKAKEVSRIRQEGAQRASTSKENYNSVIAQMTERHKRELVNVQLQLELKQNVVDGLESEKKELGRRLLEQTEQLTKRAENHPLVAGAKREAALALEEVKKQAENHQHAIEALRIRHEAELNAQRDHVRKTTIKMTELEGERDAQLNKLKMEHEVALKGVSTKAEARISNLDRSNAALREELKKVQTTAATAEEMTGIMGMLRSVITQQSSEIQRVNESLKKVEEEKTGLAVEVKKLREEVTSLKTEVEEEKQKVEDIEVEQAKIIEEETKAAEMRVTAAEGQMKKSKGDLGALKASIDTLKMDYEARMKVAAGKQKEAEENAVIAQGKLRQMENERSKKLQEDQAKVDKVNDVTKRHDEDMRVLKARVDELQVEVAIHRTQAERVTSLEAEVQKLLKMTFELEEEKTAAEKERGELKEEKDDLDEKLDIANTERLAQIDKVDDLQKEIARLKKTAQLQKKETQDESARGRSPAKVQTALAAKDFSEKRAIRAPSPAKGRAVSPAKGKTREVSPAKGRAASPVGSKARAKSPAKAREPSPAKGRAASPFKDQPSAPTAPTWSTSKAVKPINMVTSTVTSKPIERVMQSSTGARSLPVSTPSSASGSKVSGSAQANMMKRKAFQGSPLTSVTDISPTKDKKPKLHDNTLVSQSVKTDSRNSTPAGDALDLPQVNRAWVRHNISLFILSGERGNREGLRCRGCFVDKKNAIKEALRVKNPAVTQAEQDNASIEEDEDDVLDHLVENHLHLMRRVRKQRIGQGKDQG